MARLLRKLLTLILINVHTLRLKFARRYSSIVDPGVATPDFSNTNIETGGDNRTGRR
jgi:hypothetical protein